MAPRELDAPDAPRVLPEGVENETTDDPLVLRALRALDDRSVRTGEAADQADVAHVSEKFGLDPVQVALLMRDGRALGLIATEPRRGADAGGTDPAEVVERVGSAAASQSEWDSLRQLFQSARRYPLLTAQQEKALARRYQLGERARRTLADATEPRPAIRAELKAQVKDGQRAKDTFICCNLRLVASVARLHRGQGVDLADLVQEGILGLIRAVEKFDHTLDYKLSTYATWWIRQAMARAIANTGRTIRLPVHIHELVRKILATERRLWWELEREPTIADIAGRLKEDPAHVAFVKQAAAGIVSLDARVRDDDEGAELIELMAGAEPSVEAQVMAVAEKEAMSQLLETLTERERRVLEMRYGLLDDERQTLEAVGTTFNVTRERIRQIETGALKKLKTTMERQGLAPAPPTLEDEPMPDPLADVPPLVRTATDALTTEPDLAELAIESPEDQ